MDVPSVSVADPGAETLIDVLPNGILLGIFRFLRYDDLIRAEQVCRRWKTVVETCFETTKFLDFRLLDEIFRSTPNQAARLPQNIVDKYSRHNFKGPTPRVGTMYMQVLEGLGRYGSSIQTLALHLIRDCLDFNWIPEIADRFPNLLTIDISGCQITNDDFKYLSRKCCQLKNVKLSFCNFAGEGLRYFLQALPGIKSLTIHFGVADASAVLSKCRSLHTLEMAGIIFGCSDTANFFRFCKECVSLRKLAIWILYMPKEMFAQIQHCSLLEELDIYDCRFIDDSTLIEISKGCPNLSLVSLSTLPLVTDKGLKCLTSCTNLRFFSIHDVGKVTDETLVELSKCVNLREVQMWSCPSVSDRGCAALLAHCPRLELLNVHYCKGVSNATVDSAIEAVKCRHSGLALQLKIIGTSVTPQKFENCHPLLSLNNEL